MNSRWHLIRQLLRPHGIPQFIVVVGQGLIPTQTLLRSCQRDQPLRPQFWRRSDVQAELVSTAMPLASCFRALTETRKLFGAFVQGGPEPLHHY